MQSLNAYMSAVAPWLPQRMVGYPGLMGSTSPGSPSGMYPAYLAQGLQSISPTQANSSGHGSNALAASAAAAAAAAAAAGYTYPGMGFPAGVPGGMPHLGAPGFPTLLQGAHMSVIGTQSGGHSGSPTSPSAAAKSRTKRPRVRVHGAKLERLKTMFEENQYPSRSVCEATARELDLPTHSVVIWFQNRRAKLKRQLRKKQQEEAAIPSAFAKQPNQYSQPKYDEFVRKRKDPSPGADAIEATEPEDDAESRRPRKQAKNLSP